MAFGLCFSTVFQSCGSLWTYGFSCTLHGSVVGDSVITATGELSVTMAMLSGGGGGLRAQVAKIAGEAALKAEIRQLENSQ